MPAYSYTALNEAGVKKKGILSADSEREARKLVKDLKLTPIKVSESKNLSKALKIKEKDIIVMTRQLSTLLEANTPLIEAIEITANQIRNKNLVYILFSLKEEIVQGKKIGLCNEKSFLGFSLKHIFQWFLREIHLETCIQFFPNWQIIWRRLHL